MYNTRTCELLASHTTHHKQERQKQIHGSYWLVAACSRSSGSNSSAIRRRDIVMHPIPYLPVSLSVTGPGKVAAACMFTILRRIRVGRQVHNVQGSGIETHPHVCVSFGKESSLLSYSHLCPRLSLSPPIYA
jgi:hypothetical protein